MRCPCGEPLRPRARFCHRCGLALAPRRRPSLAWAWVGILCGVGMIVLGVAWLVNVDGRAAPAPRVVDPRDVILPPPPYVKQDR